MSRTTCQDNPTFKIIVRLTDCNGVLFDPAIGPTVDIFAPAADISDDITATVLSASTASLGAPGQTGTNLIVHEGTGLYSYTFPIDADMTIGAWTDRWTFTEDTVATTVSFSFVVVARARLESSIVLGNNTLVRITLDSTIASIDPTGVQLLATDQIIDFYTPFSPMYSSEELVLLEAGGHINGALSSTLKLAIYRASLTTDQFTFATTITNASWFRFARQKVATCMAAKTILSNMASNMVKKKQLADLSVEYDLTYANKIQDLEMCVQEYLPVLQTGGAAGIGTSLKPLSVTPGSLDPDYPEFGRSYSNQNSTRSGANTKVAKKDAWGNDLSRLSRSYRARNKSNWNK